MRVLVGGMGVAGIGVLVAGGFVLVGEMRVLVAAGCAIVGEG